MGYEAGNLELSILGFSEKAVASIDVTAKALRRLASAVDKINNTQFVYAGDKLEVIFSKIAKATNSINTTNITNLASAAKSLSSISRLSNLDKMDFAKVGKGFETLSVAIQPFLDKVQSAEASLTALDGILKRTSGKKIQGLLGGGATENKSGGFLGLAKLGVNLYMMRRLGRFVGELVQAGSDYNETLNLWQVAMRNNLDVADQFVNKMQKAYGISSKTLMNAQAVFKNMIGSLGQISDETAYALSEALVQMSVDYASLYNRTLESAFQNMQSMLAGQVRPIRSAGLDITETTLYQYYQQIGGTKAMRQLTRTEKQLLSILAVYKQMGSAGALGDMSKTLNQFANQSRMMTEYWAELKTWSGLLLKDLIDQSGMLVYINALLITATEIIKAIAKSRGIGDDNFLTGIFETAEATNEEVDELQGKLLDFDKFRSLEGVSASPIAIDEKLLQAITEYSSKIDQAENKAQKLADTWLKFWLNDEGFLTDQAQDLLDTIKALTVALIAITAVSFLGKIEKLTLSLGSFVALFETISLAGFVVGVDNAVKSLEEGNIVLFGLSIALAGLASSLIILKFSGESALEPLNLIKAALAGISMALLGIEIRKFVDSLDQGVRLKHIVSAFVALAAAIGGAAISLHFLTGNYVVALGVAAAAAAGMLSIFSAIPNFEKGASDIDSGTIFRAGEFGKTEAVYTGSNGKTNVANVRQMEQAFYNALSRHSREGNGTIVVQAVLDGEVVYENTTSRAKARGQTWAKA